MGSRVAREIYEFDTQAEFAAAGGAAGYGDGLAVIAGNLSQIRSGGQSPIKLLSTASANGYLVMSSYGNSIDNMGSASLAASPSNDVSSFNGAIPGASENLTLNGVAANFLASIYPMRKGTNCGVDGRSVATMVSNEAAASTTTTRKVLDTVNTAPNVLLFVGGAINDLTAATYVNGAIAEASYQSILANLKTIIDFIATANIELCMICPALGYSTGITGISGSPPANSNNGWGVREAVVRLGNDVGAYVAANALANIVAINPVGFSADASGAFLPGFVRSTDGVHMDYWGTYNVALKLRDIVEGVFGPPARTLFPGKNLAHNAMMANVTGTWPTDWSVNINANGSLSEQKIETIAGVRWATAVITSTAADALNFFIRLPFNPSSAADGTIPAINVAVGEKYGVECDFFIEGANGAPIENLSLWQSYIRYTKTGGVYLQPTFSFPQNAADVLNHGRLQFKPNFVITFQDAGSALAGASCWFAPFSAQTVQGPIGSKFKIGVANYRVVKL